MARGGVNSFAGLADAVGNNSSVDGTSRAPLVLSRSVPLKDLVGNPNNPRDSIGDLDNLRSIAEMQLQPVVVVTRGAFEQLYPESKISARWVVVLGNRRLAAAHKFGRSELDIVIKDELAKDRGTLLSAIIAENVDRDGFDVIEEAKAVESLVVEFGSADAAAEHLHKSKTWVSQRRALLKLAPEIQEATRRGDLAIREARSLARVPLEQQVERWNSVRRRSDVGAGDEGAKADGQASGEGRGMSSRGDSAAPTLRPVTKAIRNFDSEPRALAVALRDHLGDAGVKTLASHLRKLAK